MDRKKSKIKDKEFMVFISKIKKKFSIEKAILFGSRAKGKENIYSDYDIILISKKFENIKWHKRIENIAKLWKLDKDIDILPYTPKEFKEKLQLRCIVKEAVKEGIFV